MPRWTALSLTLPVADDNDANLVDKTVWDQWCQRAHALHTIQDALDQLEDALKHSARDDVYGWIVVLWTCMASHHSLTPVYAWFTWWLQQLLQRDVTEHNPQTVMMVPVARGWCRHIKRDLQTCATTWDTITHADHRMLCRKWMVLADILLRSGYHGVLTYWQQSFDQGYWHRTVRDTLQHATPDAKRDATWWAHQLTQCSHSHMAASWVQAWWLRANTSLEAKRARRDDGDTTSWHVNGGWAAIARALCQLPWIRGLPSFYHYALARIEGLLDVLTDHTYARHVLWYLVLQCWSVKLRCAHSYPPLNVTQALASVPKDDASECAAQMTRIFTKLPASPVKPNHRRSRRCHCMICDRAYPGLDLVLDSHNTVPSHKTPPVRSRRFWRKRIID